MVVTNILQDDYKLHARKKVTAAIFLVKECIYSENCLYIVAPSSVFIRGYFITPCFHVLILECLGFQKSHLRFH